MPQWGPAREKYSKAATIQKMHPLEDIAMEGKLNDSARMIEDSENPLNQKADRREKLNQQVEEAQKAQRRKIERLQHSLIYWWSLGMSLRRIIWSKRDP